MTLFTIYLFKSSISLAILVMGYELIQKRESYFNFNRVYLLFTAIIVSLLPLFNFNIFNSLLPFPVSQEFVTTFQVTSFTLPEITVGETASQSPNWNVTNVLLIVYLAGVVVKTIYLLARSIKLIQIIQHTRGFVQDKIRYVFTKGDLPVFSFFNNVFIDEETFKSGDARQIISHEKVHISQLHSLDLIAAELLCIVQWFNPFAYLLKKSIRENHEFIADREVISTYKDPTSYRLLLLNYSSGIKTNSLAHNFSYLLLKRRLHMTKKPKRNLQFSLSLVVGLLAFSAVLIACSQPKQNDEYADEYFNQQSLTDSVYKTVEVMPEYPGGMDSLIAFLSRNIQYPSEAKSEGVEGKVLVSFIIDKTGNVNKVRALNAVGYGCDEEAVRVISMMPEWKPGKNDGKNVNVEYKIPISFNLGQKVESEKVFQEVDQMPEFPGGTAALIKYLGSETTYPDQAKKDSIQGKVFVTFVIEKNGAVNDVKILRGIGGGCDKESIRVVSSMPNWKPGFNEHGKAVRVAYTLPIKYALN